MDWHVDPADPGAVASLRRDVGTYLRRHGARSSDFAQAELALKRLLEGVTRRRAGRAWVHLDWSDSAARLEVHAAGSGGSASRELAELEDVVEDAQGAGRPDGATVSVRLPVTRGDDRRTEPPRHEAAALPAPEEADDEGAFGKEAFLRALVVQLAQEVEREHGPDAAEAAIAGVGTAVGGRMEDEYRRARGIVERLTPEQMGDLYVRLKHAIDGEFAVLEATEEKIVLRNRRCPFGEVVERAPGLCRMTSSVFGGIAARNAGASTVQLERRIAVGDPECRVTVWLGESEGRGVRSGHVYNGHGSDEEPLRVVLAENYAFLRDPLAEALAGSGIEVVSHANTPASLLVKVEKYRPNVALIDFRESDTGAGIEAAAEIRARYPDVGVLVLAEHLAAESARELLGAGSDGVGYMLKDGLTHDELVDAVRRVHSGAAALDPEIVPELIGARDPLDELSPREVEVLGLLAGGLSNQAIADRLVVTKRAVEKHVKSIFRKLRLDASSDSERRVLAALRFLESGRGSRAPARS